MGLGFLVPAFLLGLAALAIPVIVHLRQRERRQPIRFPSLMFLSRVPYRTTERKRITNRLLLLLRALAVTALVLAFARPFLARDPEALAAQRDRALVILLDRSMSMGYAGVWERALDSVRAAVGGLGPGERAALIAFDQAAEVVSPLSEDPATLLARLASLAPSPVGTRLGPAFRAAREVAAQAEARVELLLVSDLQRQSLAGLEHVDPIPGATFRIAAVGPAVPINAQVLSVTVDRSVVGQQVELRVAARLAAQGGEARRERALLLVGGRQLTSAPVDLPGEGVATVTFPAVRVPDGPARASVRLAADALAADDEFRFTLGGPAGVRVALLVPPDLGADQLVYLERALALSRSPALIAEVRRAGLRPADLERVGVVVAADLAPVTGAAAALRDFVAQGGGLVVFSGPRAGRGDAPAWLGSRVGPVVDRTRDRGATLGWVQADHPVFEPFRETASADLGTARFFRYRDVTPDSAAASLARFDDGRPVLVEARVGNGRVLVVATAADAVWSDLPLQPVYLPLVHRLVSYAANAGDERRSWEVGGVVTLPGGPELAATRPDGSVERVASDTAARRLALGAVGFYEVRAAGQPAPASILAVNPPTAESDLRAAGPGEVLALLRAPIDSDPVATEPAELSPGEQEARQAWWLWLVAGALALLAAETWYAGRLSGRAHPKGGRA